MDILKIDTPDIAKILLGYNPEPCFYLNDKEVDCILRQKKWGILEKLESAFKSWAYSPNSVIMPKKQIMQDGIYNGDLRLMPCFVCDSDGNEVFKTIKIVGTNEEQRIVKDKITVGKCLLIHPTDNYVMGIIDACAISSFRTAATAVLAFKFLANSSIKNIGIIGCGRIGYYTLELLSAIRELNDIYCYDIDDTRTNEYIELANNNLNISPQKSSLNELLNSVEAIFLSTTSTSSIISKKSLNNNIRFISSVGADADNLSELDADLIGYSNVFVDSIDSAICGDLKKWIMDNKLKINELIEIKEVLSRKTNSNPNKINMFISTGIAFTDNVVLKIIFDHINKKI